MPIFNVPGRGRVQLPDGYTQEEYALAISKLSGADQYQPEFSLGQKAFAPIARTLQNIGTSLTTELPAMGLAAIGKDEAARQLLGEAKQRYAETERMAPRMYQSYEDVTGPLSALGFAYERAGEALPYGLAMLLPGGAAAAGARGIAARAGTAATEAALARGLPAAAAESLGAARATQVMQRAGLGGAGVGGYALNAPETFAKVAEETGELRPGVAATAAIGQTLLDLVAPSAFLSKLGMFGKLKAGEEVAKRAGFTEAAKDLAIAAAKTAPKEGLTEAAQEVIGNAAVDFVRGSGDLFSPERIKQYIEAGLSGAVGGGALGAAGRGIQRIGMPVEQPAPTQQAAVTEPQVTQPVVDDTILKYQIPPAGGITPETVTDQALTPQPSSVGYQVPPEIFTETPVDQKYFEQFVADIMAGVPRQAPEDQQFYANNAPAIEQRLREAQAAPALPAPTPQETGELSIPVPQAEVLQLAAPGQVAAEQVVEEGPPEFVEPPPMEGPAPLSEEDQRITDEIAELEKQAAELATQKEAVEARERKRKTQGDTFLNALKKAGVSAKDVADIRRTQSDKNLDKAVVSGLLDPWLGEFSSVAVDQADVFDQKMKQNEAVEYLKDRILNYDYVSDTTKAELADLDLKLDEVLTMIREFRSELEANLKAAEAADEQRVVYEQVEQAIPEGEERVAEPGEAAGTEREAARAEVTFTPRSYAEQMMDGTLPDTDEAYDFFVENREAIEKEVDELQKQVVQQSRKGTDEEKKFLDDLVKNNPKLEVAYQDGPLALIRTYGDKYGSIMYLAMNGSRHEYVDVADGTTALLTTQQRAKLIAAKKAIEDAEQKKHDANPFIKFDPSGVTASANVPKELTQVLLGWKNLLKIKPNIYVTTISEAKANREKYTGPHRKIGSAGLNNEYGRMGGMPDGNYFIAFTDGMSTSKMLETLAHELGHIHMYEVFEKTDVQTHNEIVREFNKFIRSSKGKDAREFIQSFRPRGIGKVTKGGEGLKAEQLAPYWTSFHEWYADQVSRWATTSAKPLTVVEKFFKRLADALKSFYAKLRNQKYLPNETFKQYLDKVSADSWDITPEKIKPLGSAEQMPLFMSSSVSAATNAGKDMSIDERQDLFNAVDKIDDTPAEGMKSMDTMIKDTPSFAATKEKLRQFVGDASMNSSKNLMSFLNMRQLSELAKKELPQFAEYYRVLTNMLNDRDAKLTEAAKTLQEWQDWSNKNPKLGKALDEVMLDARMSGIDPTDPIKAEKIKKESFRKNWEMIKGTEGEKLFIKIRDFYKAQLLRKKDIIERRLMTALPDGPVRQANLLGLRQQFEKFLNDGPYFPLNRFGDYFVAYDVRLPSGDVVPYHEMFESQADQRAHLQSIEKDIASGKVKNLKTGVDSKELFSQGVIKSAFLNDIFDAIDKTDVGDLVSTDTKARLKDDIYQAYLSIMPDLSVHKHFIHAKKVKGASMDMKRAFAETVFHSTYHLARLEYGGSLDAIVGDAQKYFNERGGNARGRYLNELKQQHAEFSAPQKQNPIWSKISNFAFMFYLTAPASALVNLTQTPIIGMPTLAGKFNVSFTKASAALTGASKDFMSSRTKLLEFDLEGKLRKAGKTFEADALKALESTINRTQTLSLAGISERPSALYASGIRGAMQSKGLGIFEKVSLGLGYMFNQAELFNRQVTALAAIRLAREINAQEVAAGRVRKYGDGEIIGLARDLVDQIHFEYASETKPRFMRGPIGQVALQFKNYAQQMTYLLVDTFNKAFLSNKDLELLRLKTLDKGLSEEERADAKRVYNDALMLRKEARKKFTGIMGMTALFAGYEGLPLYWVVEGVMNTLFGDDDEPYDFSLEMKVAMAELFGDNFARAMSRGPMSELLQIDLASRTSLNGIWFRDDATAKDEEEWVKNMVIDLLGPSVGIVVNTGDAIKKINEGHYARGMEAMMPPVIKDFFKAYRFSTEGATTLRGDPIVADVGLFGIFAQAVGFTPQDVARSYEAMGEIKGIEKALDMRRTRLLGKLWLAQQAGDYEAFADLGDEIVKFNAANPSEAIDDKTIRRSFAQREKAASRAERGIIVSPKREYLLEKTAYLDEE
jgi:hypothetical protein